MSRQFFFSDFRIFFSFNFFQNNYYSPEKNPIDFGTGSKGEILRGPLYYGLVFVAATLLAFQRLDAAAALSALCFGDAAAETIGKRFGDTNRLPWSPRKSAAGSCAFFLASTCGLLLFFVLFQAWGFTTSAPFLPAIAAAAVGTLVESLPIPDLDNVFVPASVGLVFHHLSGDAPNLLL